MLDQTNVCMKMAEMREMDNIFKNVVPLNKSLFQYH